MGQLEEVKSAPKYYWSVQHEDRIYTLLYKSEENLNELKTRWNEKLDDRDRYGYPIAHLYHYHTEDNLPVYLVDEEDLVIFMVQQDMHNPKNGFKIYSFDHKKCL